jgi:hypothetical protein
MDMMYRLVLRAQFENQAELNRAIEGLNQLQISGAKVNVQMGGMGQASSVSLNSLANSAMRVGFMFNMMESAFMRQEMASMMAEAAQNRLNDAIARYGANSEEARRAMKQNETEMAYLNNANMRANVSMGLMATMLVLQSGILESTTIKQIAHTATTIAATVADWAHVAALSAVATLEAMLEPWMVPAMIGGGAAIASAIAAYAVTRGPVAYQANFDIKTDMKVETSLDDAIREQNRQIKNEFRRASA